MVKLDGGLSAWAKTVSEHHSSQVHGEVAVAPEGIGEPERNEAPCQNYHWNQPSARGS